MCVFCLLCVCSTWLIYNGDQIKLRPVAKLVGWGARLRGEPNANNARTRYATTRERATRCPRQQAREALKTQMLALLQPPPAAGALVVVDVASIVIYTNIPIPRPY